MPMFQGMQAVLRASTVVAIILLPHLAAAQPGADQPAQPKAAQPSQPKAAPSSPVAKPDEKSAGKAEPNDPNDPAHRQELLDGLYGQLSKAPDAQTAQTITETIDKLWQHSGSDTTNLLVQRALAAAGNKNFALALKLLDTVVELQPDYADGWSRRAYVYFLTSDSHRAIGDLRRALALDPNHFRALEGLAQILRDMGEKKGALQAYRKLLEINPQATGAKDAITELTRDVEGQGI